MLTAHSVVGQLHGMQEKERPRALFSNLPTARGCGPRSTGQKNSPQGLEEKAAGQGVTCLGAAGGEGSCSSRWKRGEPGLEVTDRVGC